MTSLDPEAAARVLAYRRARDPVHYFFHVADDEHTKAQRATMQTSASFRAIKSGSRGGKSTTSAADIAASLRGVHPYRLPAKRPLAFALLVPKRSVAGDTWMTKLLLRSELQGDKVPDTITNAPFIPDREIQKAAYDHAAGRKVPTKITMKNGNTLRLFWTDSPQALSSFEGGHYDWIWIDEGACSEDLLPSVYTRCTDAMSTDVTPGYGGITWSATAYSGKHLGFARFLEDCQDEKKPEWVCFELDLATNPAISAKAMDTIEKGMTAEQIAVRRYGLTAFDRLMVYPQLDPVQHVSEERLVPPSNATVYYINDPGAGHAAGHLLVYFTQEHPTTMHVWKAWEALQQTYDLEARWVAENLDGRFLEAVVLDPNATRTEKRQAGFTSAAEGIRQALERYGYSQQGGTIKRGFLLPERKTDEMGSINSRKAGVSDVRQWLDENRIVFNPCEEDGGPLALKRMNQYRFKEATLYRGYGTIVDKHTEIPDCIRYAIRWRLRWVDRGPNEPSGALLDPLEITEADIRRERGRRIARRVLAKRNKGKRPRASDL